eukprot:TRINITY_DN15583_c0_g1_i1.p1 TRINITY_DN15583_c0_g1~~TRINITY_DN15583_c0_g1_i1.p1  ORF type:complete len:145 (-),score=23.82 TRINITY_DN15583_c0_g1_i1:164-541(-)
MSVRGGINLPVEMEHEIIKLLVDDWVADLDEAMGQEGYQDFAKREMLREGIKKHWLVLTKYRSVSREWRQLIDSYLAKNYSDFGPIIDRYRSSHMEWKESISKDVIRGRFTLTCFFFIWFAPSFD